MSSRQETRNLTLNYSASTIPTPLAGLSANGFIIQRATKEDFPAKGNEAGVYVEGTTGKVYYWRDNEYHETIVSTDGYIIDGAVLMLKTKTATEWETENPILAKGEVGFISDQNVFKVGDGESAFKDLSILSASSTDVPNWAKQETPNFTIDNVDGLEKNLTEKQADISSLQSLVGEEKVSEQIQNAISDLDLSNTYEPLGAVSELEARTKAALKSTTDPMIAETQAVREIAESKTTMLDVEKKDYATKAQVDEKIQALDYVDKDNSGYFINSISETDGIIKVTHRAISSNDIPIISQSKVNNLPQILEKKQNTIVWENNNYDGLNNKAVTKKDLDEAFKKVSSAIQFKGVVTELPESAQNGDMYIMGSKEYLYVVDDTGARFEELGDQDLYAIKGEISNSDIASDAAISQDKIAGLADSLAEKVNVSALDTMAYEDKKDYPTHTYLTQVVQGLYVRDTNVKKNFVYAVDQTNGVVEAKKRELDVTDIPALTVNKITGLQSSLDAKVETTDFEAQKTQTTEDISTAKTEVLNTIQEKIDSGEFKGDKGDNGYVHIAYANSTDGKDFTLAPEDGKTYEYLGQYTNNTETASTEWSDYKWSWLTDEASRQTAETARTAAETARATAEESRDNAEKTRATAESERKEAESARVEADAKRQTINDEQIAKVQDLTTAAAESEKNAKASEMAAATSESNASTSEANAKASETTVEGYIDTIAKEPVAQDILAAAKEISEQVGILVQADSDETIRKENEETRIANETERQNAESTRNDNENARSLAESARQTAETSRANAENARETAESSRTSAETSRANAESSRVTAESARVTAENARATAESERVAHEAERQAALDKAVSAAEMSESNAATSESNASASATAAAASESNASTSETNAKTSEETVAGYVETIAKEATAADILAAVQTCNSLLQQILDKESEA